MLLSTAYLRAADPTTDGQETGYRVGGATVAAQVVFPVCFPDRESAAEHAP